MEDKKNKLFPTLERLLKRVNLDKQILPSTLAEWNELIDRINQSFNDFEQERYLLERSMEISSKEMLELNERLETAQNIAHIGYWFYNPLEDKILWSKETYRIFGLDPAYPVPPYSTVMQMFHENDRQRLSQLIDRAIEQRKDYEAEVRVINSTENKIIWTYIKGHSNTNKKDKVLSKYLLSGIIMDITERKSYEEEVQSLNQQLVSIARKAGMSEVATSVLHNLGNVLNSVNISISMIQELACNNKIQNVGKAAAMISENLERDPNYLLNDEKGKLIPKYLADLSHNLTSEQEELRNEIQNLIRNVQHIKDIVFMQKDISGVSSVSEKIDLSNMINIALQISCPAPEKYGISIIKKFKFNDSIIIDKSKLLQILVNLIQNAKEAIEIEKPAYGTITITTTKKKNSPNIEIIVEDNGMGIKKDNLHKIFSMGFTTKETGHGFGLHSCAITAKELGGKLTAESKGEGHGAAFVLELPVTVKEVVKST